VLRMGFGFWHLMILVLIFAVVAGGIVGLIVKFAKPISVNPLGVAGAATAGAPGWYPDPNDAGLVRYFDGRVWTSSTQPRG
jgi:hypothetical protein